MSLVPTESDELVAEAVSAERERCARLIEELRDQEGPGRAKLMLTIGAHAVRRGRHLTDEERWNNVRRWLAEPDEAAP